MSKPGPPPTPTAILKKRGSWLAKTRGGEPVGTPSPPERPAGLSEAAVQHWDGLIADLENLGVLCVTDGRALGRYCEMLVKWDSILDLCQKHGDVYAEQDSKGRTRVRVFEHSKFALDISDRLSRMEAKFGLTPSDRAAIGSMRQEPSKHGNSAASKKRESYLA